MNILKILVIRFRRVGDATLSVVLCTSLKKSFPNAEIHYVLNENIAPLFSDHPDIDKVITFSNEDLSKITRYANKVRSIVRNEKYNIIIDTRATIKTLFFSAFSLKTPYRIGRRKAYNRIIHNYRVDNYPDGVHDNIALTLKLLDPLADKFQIEKDSEFKLYVSDEYRNKYRQYLLDKGIDFNKPIVICAVASRGQEKMWSSHNMKKTLENIIYEYQNAQLIFNYGDKAEQAIAQDLFEEMGSPSQVFINIEAKDLIELKALLSYSSFFFGNEGGPRHIAQALGVPSFAIFSPRENKTYWLPNQNKVNQGIELKDIDPLAAINIELTDRQKYDMITVESVWTKLNKMLKDILE